MEPNKSTEEAPQRMMVRIGDISEQPQYQARSACDHSTVTSYATAMQQGAEFPPVKVAMIGGAMVLLSGAHRLRAASRAGRTEILAEVLAVDHAEATRVAITENMKHGKRLTKPDMRRALMLFIDAGLHRVGRGRVMSSRTLAQEALAGLVNHDTVIRWVSEDRPAVYAAMRRSGPVVGRGKPFDHQRKAQEQAADSAMHSAVQIVAAMRGIHEPELRGKVIAALRRALTNAELAAPFEEPPGTHGDTMSDF